MGPWGSRGRPHSLLATASFWGESGPSLSLVPCPWTLPSRAALSHDDHPSPVQSQGMGRSAASKCWPRARKGASWGAGHPVGGDGHSWDSLRCPTATTALTALRTLGVWHVSHTGQCSVAPAGVLPLFSSILTPKLTQAPGSSAPQGRPHFRCQRQVPVVTVLQPDQLHIRVPMTRSWNSSQDSGSPVHWFIVRDMMIQMSSHMERHTGQGLLRGLLCPLQVQHRPAP